MPKSPFGLKQGRKRYPPIPIRERARNFAMECISSTGCPDGKVPPRIPAPAPKRRIQNRILRWRNYFSPQFQKDI